MSESQVHSCMKMFSGALNQFGTLSQELKEKVSKFFVDHPTISAKSVGVEFVESRNLALVSVGYAPGNGGLPVSIACVRASKLGDAGEADLDRISEEMSAAAAAVGNVICHEFYVTADGSLFAVFLTNSIA